MQKSIFWEWRCFWLIWRNVQYLTATKNSLTPSLNYALTSGLPPSKKPNRLLSNSHHNGINSFLARQQIVVIFHNSSPLDKMALHWIKRLWTGKHSFFEFDSCSQFSICLAISPIWKQICLGHQVKIDVNVGGAITANSSNMTVWSVKVSSKSFHFLRHFVVSYPASHSQVCCLKLVNPLITLNQVHFWRI